MVLPGEDDRIWGDLGRDPFDVSDPSIAAPMMLDDSPTGIDDIRLPDTIHLSNIAHGPTPSGPEPAIAPEPARVQTSSSRRYLWASLGVVTMGLVLGMALLRPWASPAVEAPAKPKLSQVEPVHQPAAPVSTLVVPDTPNEASQYTWNRENVGGQREAASHLTSAPSGARVDVDGEAKGRTPLDLPLPAGPHIVTFHAPGFRTITRILYAGMGAHIDFSRAITRTELLLLSRTGEHGLVKVDGYGIDQLPKVIEIEPGSHVIEVQGSDGGVLRRELFAKDAETTTFFVAP